MSVTKEDILEATESSLFVGSFPEDVLLWTDIEGVKGRYSPTLSHPVINLIGEARLDDSNADGAIEQVKSYFDKREQTIGWFTSPLGTPANLDEKLMTAGFAHIGTFEGRFLNLANHGVKGNPDVTVRKATPADNDLVARLYRDAYPIPGDVATAMIGWCEAMDAANYLAYVDDMDEPVSIATMFYYPGKQIVALQGAATLEEFRGRGIYTSLMAKRLDDAKADGLEVAIMQADATTSGPIVSKLGFEYLCDLKLFMYPAPEDGEGH